MFNYPSISFMRAALVLLCCVSTNAFAQPDYPEDVLAQAKDYEDWFISGDDAYGVGVILMGQLVLSDGGDPTLSAFRDNFFEDGYFATYLYPGRSMTFWQHGYQPVVLDYPYDKKGIVDIGTITMEPDKPDQLTTVSGTVSLDAPAKGPATVELWVRMPPSYLDDDGHLGGCRVSYRVESKSVASGDSFQFDNLSPIGYELKYTAPGHIREIQRFDHRPGERIEVDTVSLEPSNRLNFVTISPLQHYDSRDLAKQVRRTVEANGKDRLVFTDERDELGNRHDFRFRTKGDAIIITYWMYPWYFIDLGETSLEEALNRSKEYKDYGEDELAAIGTIYTPLKSGHSYFFSCPENAVSCVFSVNY